MGGLAPGRLPPVGAGLQPFHLFGSPDVAACVLSCAVQVRVVGLVAVEGSGLPVRFAILIWSSGRNTRSKTASAATINPKEQQQKTKCICELFACRVNLCYSITSYFLVCLPLYCGPKSLSPVLCSQPAMFGCTDFTNLGPSVLRFVTAKGCACRYDRSS